MTNKKLIDDNVVEFDFLIRSLWDGKWKMLISILASISLFFIFQFNHDEKFTATTEILPINSKEADKYIAYNTLVNRSLTYITENPVYASQGIFNDDSFITITKSLLLSKYIEEFNNSLLFEKGIHKFKMVDRSKYDNEKDYSIALSKFASSINVKKKDLTKNKLTDLESYVIPELQIEMTYNDIEKWKSFLYFVDKNANLEVRKYLQERFKTSFEIAVQNRNYAIDDTQVVIDNLIEDYERITSDKLAFLTEQSTIAKQLGIAKNTIEVQTFGSQNAMLSNLNIDSPFYLRGYEAIEKEIELIKLRTDKNAFISGLFTLEKKVRDYEQDKTLDRIKKLYFKTPVIKKSDEPNYFVASNIKIESTKFFYEDKTKSFIGTILMGLLIGLLYIFIPKLFKLSNPNKKR